MKILYLLSIGIVGCSSMSWAMDDGERKLASTEGQADIVVAEPGGADALGENNHDLEANTGLRDESDACGNTVISGCLAVGCIGVIGVMLWQLNWLQDFDWDSLSDVGP